MKKNKLNDKRFEGVFKNKRGFIIRVKNTKTNKIVSVGIEKTKKEANKVFQEYKQGFKEVPKWN